MPIDTTLQRFFLSEQEGPEQKLLKVLTGKKLNQRCSPTAASFLPFFPNECPVLVITWPNKYPLYDQNRVLSVTGNVYVQS